MSTPSPVLTVEELRTLAHEILAMTTASVVDVWIEHVARGITRISHNHVRLNDNGDTLRVSISTRFGRRGAGIGLNQIDLDTLRTAVRYIESVAREMPGDPAATPDVLPLPPRKYLPNTAWFDSTATAFGDDRHAIAPILVQPMLEAKLVGAAFLGVSARSTAYVNKRGFCAVGQETDAELNVTGWNPSGASGVAGSGWAGQATRDWSKLNPAAVAAEAVRITKLATNPVAFEPGRRTAILAPPAVAQIVRGMGNHFDAYPTLAGSTPLSGYKVQDKVLDERVTLTSDPNDPDGGYLPFDPSGFPRLPMTWLEQGRLLNLAWETNFAAQSGVTPANLAPESLRLSAAGSDGSGASAGLATLDEMIANCKEGIYVNRFADIMGVHRKSGLVTGVTNGGCFLIRNGKIDKALKDFRFLDSPYFFLNRLEAIGRAERAAFGYAPGYGEWPTAPTIVPPVMVRDFNFNALADAV